MNNYTHIHDLYVTYISTKWSFTSTISKKWNVNNYFNICEHFTPNFVTLN